MTTLVEIKEQLKAPFALEDIDFLPKGKPIERDGKHLIMSFAFADPRVYQDRLNELAYGEWSTPAPVVIAAGNKLICYVTVVLFGVPHTDVGEAVNNEDNTGTESYAQAFKRACSQFGLGRYLYDLDKEWVPFNPQRKVIDLDATGKRAIVQKMYKKAGIATSDSKSAPQPQSNREEHIPLNTPGLPTSTINEPTPWELRERHKFLKMHDDFETIKQKLFKRKITDGELTPEQCITISGVLERFYEKERAS